VLLALRRLRQLTLATAGGPPQQLQAMQRPSTAEVALPSSSTSTRLLHRSQRGAHCRGTALFLPSRETRAGRHVQARHDGPCGPHEPWGEVGQRVCRLPHLGHELRT